MRLILTKLGNCGRGESIDMNRYRVTLEYIIRDTVEVEAVDENAAEALAMEEAEVNPARAEHHNTRIKLLGGKDRRVQ